MCPASEPSCSDGNSTASTTNTQADSGARLQLTNYIGIIIVGVLLTVGACMWFGCRRWKGRPEAWCGHPRKPSSKPPVRPSPDAATPCASRRVSVIDLESASIERHRARDMKEMELLSGEAQRVTILGEPDHGLAVPSPPGMDAYRRG